MRIGKASAEGQGSTAKAPRSGAGIQPTGTTARRNRVTKISARMEKCARRVISGRLFGTGPLYQRRTFESGSVGGEVFRRDFAVECKPNFVALDPRDLGGGAEIAALQQNVALGEITAFENDLGALARKIADAHSLRAAAGHEAGDHEH